MNNQKGVNIELIKGTLDDYIIKDKDKIVIGRFTITELDKENKKNISKHINCNNGRSYFNWMWK